MRRTAAFTLVEIMIVVAIIAVLAAVAIPAIVRARQQTQNAKFLNALRVATSAIDQYVIENQKYPPDANRGVLPPGLATYFDNTFDWTAPTPIGGQWDWELNVFSIKAGLSVVNPGIAASQLSEIDSKCDDGNLATGRFQTIGPDRYTDIFDR